MEWGSSHGSAVDVQWVWAVRKKWGNFLWTFQSVWLGKNALKPINCRTKQPNTLNLRGKGISILQTIHGAWAIPIWNCHQSGGLIPHVWTNPWERPTSTQVQGTLWFGRTAAWFLMVTLACDYPLVVSPCPTKTLWSNLHANFYGHHTIPVDFFYLPHSQNLQIPKTKSRLMTMQM